ncbi:MAG: hypothetical protein K1060chlam4_00035 [Candidatus Anoxychlamydiales bacterium]|nr:hypothetical protein [Candidatus Anoxychlamydiales bacterium]
MRFFLSLISVLMLFSSLFADDYFSTYFDKVGTASLYLKETTNANPKLLIVLTPGVEGSIQTEEMKDIIAIDSRDIPYFPKDLPIRIHNSANRFFHKKIIDLI